MKKNRQQQALLLSKNVCFHRSKKKLILEVFCHLNSKIKESNGKENYKFITFKTSACTSSKPHLSLDFILLSPEIEHITFLHAEEGPV